MKKNRDSRFELLKIIAIFLIVLSHILPFTQSDLIAYVNLYKVSENFQIWILQFFKYCGQIGNAIFIICSAYFLIDNKCSVKKILKLIFQTLFYSYLFLIFFLLVINVNLSVKDIIKQLMPITFQMNWYVSCYIVFYFISPLLRNSISNLDKNTLKKIIFIFILIYSILPLMIDHHFEYSNLFGMIIIYYVVFYLKKYKIKFFENKKNCIKTFFISVGSLFTYIILINYIGCKTNIGVLQNKALFWCNYTKLPCLLVAISLFYIIKNMRTFNNKIINIISSTSLGIYLISDNYLLRKNIIPIIFERIYYYNEYRLIALDCVLLSILFFIISLCIELIRKYTFEKWFDIMINNYYNKIIINLKKFIKII